MKKLLFTILFSTVLISYAQVQIKNTGYKFKVDEMSKESSLKKELILKRAAVETHSYFPFTIQLTNQSDIIGFMESAAAQADWQSYINFLYPDSLGLVVTSNGRNHVYMHMVGNSFDPKDSNIVLQDPFAPQLSKFTTYTIDTMGVRFGYHRHLDSFQGNEVVDTMIFQFFSNNQSTYSEHTVTGFESFAYPIRTNVSMSTLLSSNAAKTYRLPLTKSMATRDTTTGWVSNFIEIPVGVTIAPNGTKNSSFTYTMSFKPMVRAAVGDTLFHQPSDNVNTFKKNNYATYYFTQNEAARNAQLNQYTYFNNSIFTTKFQKYNYNTNGWTNFIPGNAYYEHQYVFAYYELTTANLAIKNSNKEVSLMNAYPNPAKSNSEVTLGFKANINDEAVVTLTDISGKVIRTMNVTIFNGNNEIALSTEGLNNGMYLINIEGSEFKSTSKLIIE
jgi:hypothetical protein